MLSVIIVTLIHTFECPLEAHKLQNVSVIDKADILVCVHTHLMCITA